MKVKKTIDVKRWIVIGGACCVILAAGGYFAWGAIFGSQFDRDLSSGDPNRIIPALADADHDQFASADNKEARKEARDALENQRGAIWERMRDQNLTDEERERLHENMRTLMMEGMEERIDEYENAPEDQKEAVLDKQIDEWVARREEWRKRREARGDDEHGPGDRPGGGPGDRPGGGSGDRAGRGEGAPGDQAAAGQGDQGRRGPWGNRPRPTVQDRKRRLEGGNPDQRARMRQYFNKVRERAAERGINFGFGPGGGRGGRH
jgi:hypothetical protein